MNFWGSVFTSGLGWLRAYMDIVGNTGQPGRGSFEWIRVRSVIKYLVVDNFVFSQNILHYYLDHDYVSIYEDALNAWK